MEDAIERIREMTLTPLVMRAIGQLLEWWGGE